MQTKPQDTAQPRASHAPRRRPSAARESSVAVVKADGVNVPAADIRPGAQGFDLDDHALYLNRELTWLTFNRRVLHEAEDERTPLLERVKFLAIVSGRTSTSSS